jgi:hypothetical protein
VNDKLGVCFPRARRGVMATDKLESCGRLTIVVVVVVVIYSTQTLTPGGI